MERMWAPWRMDYIESVDDAAPGCIFCSRTDRGVCPETLIVYQDEQAMVILNKYPYNNGHIMVVPRAHAGGLDQLDAGQYHHLTDLLRKSVAIIREAYNPHGVNIGMNLGRTAGAGVEDHIHWHIVPRWNGDTNFMPVTAGVKVISEGIDRTYHRLLPLYQALTEEK